MNRLNFEKFEIGNWILIFDFFDLNKITAYDSLLLHVYKMEHVSGIYLESF